MSIRVVIIGKGMGWHWLGDEGRGRRRKFLCCFTCDDFYI
jgi:hypothetical protein